MKDVGFVIKAGDGSAEEAAAVLREHGYPVRVLETPHARARQREVALFSFTDSSASISVFFKNTHLRCASHHLLLPTERDALLSDRPELGELNSREMPVPNWVRNTPFRVAVRKVNRSGFKTSILRMADAFTKWDPGIASEQTPWVKDQAPTESYMPEYSFWLEMVHKALKFKPSLRTVLAHYGHAEFGTPLPVLEKPRVLVVGCAPFNRPHTDIGESLDELKRGRIIRYLDQFLIDAGSMISSMEFLFVGGDFVTTAGLRSSLHPFFWQDVNDLEEKMKQEFKDKPRLWGRNHRRSDEEVSEALDYGYNLLKDGIVAQLASSNGLPIKVHRWTDLLGVDRLERGWKLANEKEEYAAAERIYRQRVQDHAWYRSIESLLGSDAGLARTLGNNSAYLGLATYLLEHPDTIILDFEVDAGFWHGLLPVLKKIWGEKKPTLITAPKHVRQPWAYS